MPRKKKSIHLRVVSAVRQMSRNPYRLYMACMMKLRRRGLVPLVKNKIGPIRFTFDDSLGHYIWMMRTGEYEFETIAAMRSILRRGDVFLDVGANLGYLSAWGMRAVSRTGRVHAVEPTANMAQSLESLARMNPDYSLTVHRVAAGDTATEADAILAGDGMQGSTTLVEGLIPEDSAIGTEAVRVVRLDEYMDQQDAEKVALIKIDVEGFEFNVLKGMAGWFREGFAAPIICELTPGAYAGQNFSLTTIVEYMAGWGYSACSISDFRPIETERLPRLGLVFNVIFMKNQPPEGGRV